MGRVYKSALLSIVQTCSFSSSLNYCTELLYISRWTVLSCVCKSKKKPWKLLSLSKRVMKMTGHGEYLSQFYCMQPASNIIMMYSWELVCDLVSRHLFGPHLLSSDHTVTVMDCARELRKVGDSLDWRYKLLEILTKTYFITNVIKVKWGLTSHCTSRENG